MKKKGTGNARLIDIARIAQVSIGTVDRVIHNRGRVSEETKEKVKKAMASINYSPNPAAQILSMRTKRIIAVLVPEYVPGDYWGEVEKGITKAEKELTDYGFIIKRLHFDRYDINSFNQQIENIKQLSDIRGFVISPQYKQNSIELATYLHSQNIPFIFIDSNIDDCNPLSYFGIHSFKAGIVLASLAIDLIKIDQDILIVNFQSAESKRATQIDLIDKGFEEYIKKLDFKGKLHRLYLSPQSEKWEKELLKYLDENPNIRIATVFNSLSHHLARAKEKYEINQLQILGFDLTRKNIAYLENGYIKLLISQRPEAQGYISIKTLCRHLAFPPETVPQNNFMPVDIIIKENLEFYQEM